VLVANGKDIGYHGRTPEGEHMLGYCRYDNSEGRDVAAPPRSGHVHSLTPDCFVGDGTYDSPFLYLYRFDEDAERYEARTLARHGGSAHVQGIHVHPRFHPDPDVDQVLYTSDRKGYANVYLLDVPAFEDLPPAATGADA
jgi:oligogalacturonide lyase